MVIEPHHTFPPAGHFNGAFESAKTPAILVTPQRQIILMNQKARSLFKLSPAEASGQNLDALVLAHGGPLQLDVSLLPIELSQVNYQLCLIEDQGVQAKESEALKCSIELARSNAELEQFAHVVSHDLQAPLRQIVHCIRELEQRMQSKLDAESAQVMSYISGGARKMHTLIGSLLNLSKVEHGETLLTETPLNAVLDEVVSRLSVSIQEANASVHIDALPTLKVDSRRMTQLFQNLLENAIKFHRLGIKPQVRVSAERRGFDWFFEVTDNGIGIEEQDFERIFGIFKRLHTEDEFPGTGVGLSICKKVVTAMGGEIWCRSEFGSGTSFIVRIPTASMTSDEKLKN